TQARAAEYVTAAEAIAAATRDYAQNAAARTATEVKDLATQEKTFATKLADRVQQYRKELAQLEQAHDQAWAHWQLVHPPGDPEANNFDEQAGSNQRTNQEDAYQDDVVDLESDRRTALAQIGLDFTSALADLADGTADAIAAAQSDFESAVAGDYYHTGG